jgi:glycosyltransferase involved in cell wall biosynthesis
MSAEQPGSAQDPDRHELRDLLVSTHAPVLRSGRAVRTYGLLRALAHHRPVDVLYVCFEAAEPDSAFAAIDGVSWHPVGASRGTARALSYGRARLAGVPAALARSVSPELVAQASALALTPGRGRVIADGPGAAAALLGLLRRRPLVYNAHNLESGFRHELSGATQSQHAALRRFETRVLASFSECWMVSRADIEGARELCPDARLRYVPNVVDVAAIAPVEPARREQRAIFVASFAYEPNRRGLRFLLEEVMPRVWGQLPAAKLMLVGAGLQDPPSTDSRVETMGFVEDLHAAYARSSCAVVPLLQGGGTPLKLLEALAHGLPVIATPRASAALELREGEQCLVAEGADSFASALVAVLGDGAPELGRRGREVAERLYSIEALSELLDPSLDMRP